MWQTGTPSLGTQSLTHTHSGTLCALERFKLHVIRLIFSCEQLNRFFFVFFVFFPEVEEAREKEGLLDCMHQTASMCLVGVHVRLRLLLSLLYYGCVCVSQSVSKGKKGSLCVRVSA